MDRARLAVLAAVSVVFSVASAVFAAGGTPGPSLLGSVAWPVSTLLVSEIQTGGVSASDEFAEITNVGASAVDLSGLELAYATSTGTTVTRKASWSTSVPLEPGRHLFVANAAGVYAGLADATYSGGFAATGGAIVLRVVGGATIDAVGWGDATNEFVEGVPVAAPAAGTSIERKPGGLAGNTIDTNANSVDWFSQGAPNPQSLAAPPVPAPGPTASSVPAPSATAGPTPAATPVPTVLPTEGASPTPTATAGPTATIAPSPTPLATATSEPTSGPTASPTPVPTPTPLPTPTPSLEPTLAPTFAPTPEPSPTVQPTVEPTAVPTTFPSASAATAISIVDARALADGAPATVIGVLTTQLGALESGRKAFVQDDTAGIALYLDVAVTDGLPAGTLVMVSGTLDDRFAERTLRAALADVVALGQQSLPLGLFQQTGEIGEAVEGTRVIVEGITVGAPSDLSDGLGLMVDDGTGAVRVIVGPAALGGVSVPSGTNVVAVGPVGQRDSSGTGLAGYRVQASEAGEFEILPPPTPTPGPTSAPTPPPTSAPSSVPTASPSPRPTQSPVPTPTAAPTATPPAPTWTPAPSATPRPTMTPGPTPVIDVVEARGAAVGTVVTVTGVVTAEAGRLGIPPVIAIADGTGGIAVRLPDGAPHPTRGTTVLVHGPLADPYGQLEIRPEAGSFSLLGHGSLPVPLQLTAAQLGEATEGRLATITGTVTATPRKGTSGDLTIDITDAAGTAFRVVADGSSGIAATDLVKDHAYRLTGIVGQRASRKAALDGYRLYPRDRGDITAVPGPGPGPSGSPGPTGGSVVPVSTALAVPDGTRVTIEATITAGAQLLDASGRRIVVQDRSGAMEVLLPTGTAAPAVGATIRITGTTGRAWGAPRLAATEITPLSAGAAVSPLVLHRAPAERDEWQLVRIAGTIAKVSRIGERWQAELTLPGGTAVLLQGQAGAGIPSTSIAAGQRITVTGIVRRPYPTASDRRFAILPRHGGDISHDAGGPGGGVDGGSGGAAGGAGSSQASGDPDPASLGSITPDTDLATLADLVGQRVKVGGLVVRVAEDGFDLDDGTALARIQLEGDMLALLPHLRAGEAIAATGRVALVNGAPVVVVDADGTLVRVGTLGEGLPIAGLATPGSSHAPGAGAPVTADSSGIFGAPGPVSLFALASLTGLSVLATMVRRRLQRRRLRLAIVERLGGLTGSREEPAQPDAAGPSAGHVPAEHESA